jgi:hypothetical protein
LEEYVHKHVFPKVSAWQREYLAKYFTIIFQSGFETGDFSEWTGTNGSPTIVTSPVHHGSYAALCNSESRIYKTFSSQNVVYFRFYVQTSGVPTSSGQWIHIATVWVGTDESIQIRIQHDGTSPKFALRNWKYGILVYGTTTVQSNTWYCVEVKAHNIGYGTGDILYVNGVQEATDGTSNGAGGALTEVDVKQYTEYGYKNIYFDCVVVADTYIGPEVAVVTVTDSVGLSDVALCHKTFAVADSVGLTDVPLKSWTPTVTDVLNLLDAVLRHKQLQVSDTVSLADAALAFKILLLTDSISLTDAVSVYVGAVLKIVEDSVGLSDAVYRNKALIISDAVNVLDQVFRNKPLVSISDVLTLAEVIAVSKFFAVADSVSLSDVAKVLKQLRVSDTITIVDAAQVPSKVLKVLDSVGLSDAVKVDKVLIVSDQIALVEVVYAFLPVKKTKLFLIVGNLAIQLTGD